MKKLFMAVIFSFIIFTSCDDAAETPEPVVYVGGSFDDSGQYKACYWVNGARHELDGVSVNSIAAVKGKVYAAGYYKKDDVYIACYWVGNERYDLPGLIYYSFSIGRISVDKENVYIIGSADEGGRYWINGVIQNPPADGEMIDVYAANGNVYISGYYTEGSVVKACYWVNGARQDLSGSEGFIAGIIAVENNKVYIAGAPSWILGPIPKPEPDYIACYWDDGKQYFSQNLMIGFDVSEGDVYIAGREIFKNGKYHREGRVRYYTMFAVSRGKVYIAVYGYYEVDGEDIELNGYTVDGIAHPLDGVPNCIYVE
jgi:hypothetical protein